MKFTNSSKPVWAEGLEKEMNITCGFHAVLKAEKNKRYTITVAASTFYRLYINGDFIMHGPARCAHGFYRADEIDIAKYLKKGDNDIAIEVAGYNINAYQSLDQPSFLRAEVFEEATSVIATGRDDFSCFVLTARRRKIQRFSFQRAFGESYILSPGYDAWRIGKACSKAEKANAVVTNDKRIIPRGIPLNDFTYVTPCATIARGIMKIGPGPKEYRRDTVALNINEVVKGFPENELEIHLSDEVQHFEYTPADTDEKKYAGEISLDSGEYETVALQGEKTGFIGFDVSCTEKSVFYLLMDEIITNGDVDPHRMGCLNIIRFDLEPGDYKFLSFEEFGFKYLKAVCSEGAVKISDLHLREHRYPLPVINRYNGENEALKRIYDAAIESFCQNASDIFMDCPTRERAGWLCDSFFIGRTEHALTGENRMEKLFLENFMLPEKFEYLPDGMLPMCYPSDHNNGNFIPNWAMWFVLEVNAYYNDTGDNALVIALKDRIYALLNYFKRFENQFGLLDRLERWVFVEWSKANELIWEVNHPTNMLYAAVLDTVSAMYGDKDLHDKAEAIRETVRKRSFDGEFFVDNEVRDENGVLKATGERTETCQYYAFYFNVATPESHPELWNKLTNEFGPERMNKVIYPEIYPSNAFMGNYMRLSLLSKYGLKKQCTDEIVGYFDYMAKRTGTLWEHNTELASCNHGFASYAAVLIRELTENLL